MSSATQESEPEVAALRHHCSEAGRDGAVELG